MLPLARPRRPPLGAVQARAAGADAAEVDFIVNLTKGQLAAAVAKLVPAFGDPRARSVAVLRGVLLGRAVQRASGVGMG